MSRDSMLYERQVGSDSIVLTQAERAELEGLARSPKSEHRMRQRAQIVVLAADLLTTRRIARWLVARWAGRPALHGRRRLREQ
ncbi:MAG: hypothetical protein ACXW5W_22590 [Candidatus Binatia bacterium]